MQQSKILTDFYKEYLTWVEFGARRHPFFNSSQGLCGNLRNMLYMQDSDYDTSRTVKAELTNQFISAGLDEDYPFNCGSQIEFYRDVDKENHHKNEKRMAWVYNHANLK